MTRLSQDPAHLAPIIHVPGFGIQARRVQSVNASGERPSTDEREVGNESIVGTTFDTPNVTLDVEANLVNGKLLALVSNRASGSTWTNLAMADLIGSQDIDLQMRQRNTARTAWLQDVYVKQGAIASYRLAASTNASATETFNLTTTNKTAFERFVQVDHLTATSEDQSVFTITGTPIALTKGVNSGNQLLSVAYAQPNGSSTYLSEGEDYSVTGTTVTLSSSHAGAMVSGSTQIMFAYQLSGSTPGTALDSFATKDTVSPAAIRGYFHIPVTITANGVDKVPRGVQSIDATINFAPTREVGMGNDVIASSRQTPAEVTGSITILSENYDTERLMQTGQLAPTSTDFPIDGWRDDLRFKLEFKDPKTGTVLRTDVLSGCTITNDGKEVRVGQAVGKTYAFRASAGFNWLNSKNTA